MLKDTRKYDLPLQEAFIMFLLTLIKTIGLYISTGVNEILLVTIKTIPILFIIYGSVSLIKSRKRSIYFIIVYTVISFLLFADLVYFKYYNFMPSIKALLLAKQAAGVKGSIIYFLKPEYFLMFIDVIPLFIYLYKNRGYDADIDYRRNIATKNLVAFTVIIAILNVGIIDIDSSYVYGSNGIYTYHIYDIYETLTDNSIEVYSEDLLKEAVERTPEENAKDKKYFGIASNRNVIVIQFESLQDFLINDYYQGQEITPNLNRLIKKDSIYFSNYYQQVGAGNTSDAEFVSNNSLYPATGYSTYTYYTDNTFYTFPMVLKERGYKTIAFHGFKGEFWNREEMYPHQGIDEYISLEDFEQDDLFGLGLSDYSFFMQTLKHLKTIEKPFYSFIVTLTSHHPYIIPEDKQQLQLLDEHKGTLFGNYLQAINYSDMALGKFIEGLKKEGLYENSIIVIYGDHFGLYPTHERNGELMSEHLGREYTYNEVFNVPLIIHIPGLDKAEEKTIVGGQVDFFPTMLNLLGIENNKGILFGQDLLNIEKGYAAIQYYLPLGSFIDDEKIFVMSDDGIFENSKAWNLKTGQPVDLESCREGYERAISEKRKSDYILKSNLLEEIIKQND
jgi:phosphoglycerol transferase MdoB-like AlkP superfamily enzyme